MKKFSHSTCDECGKACDGVYFLGKGGPFYAFVICADCLQKALDILRPSQREDVIAQSQIEQLQRLEPYKAQQEEGASMNDIDIRFLRDDKLEVVIGVEHSKPLFTVTVSKDGITINGDENLAVYPAAVNVARIDYA